MTLSVTIYFPPHCGHTGSPDWGDVPQGRLWVASRPRRLRPCGPKAKQAKQRCVMGVGMSGPLQANDLQPGSVTRRMTICATELTNQNASRCHAPPRILYRVCTISATDHIDHKPYQPQPHRPHEKTISAKTNNHIGHKNSTAILSSTFVSIVSLSLRLETSYSLPSHMSRELKNSTQQLSTYFKALWRECISVA